MKDFTIAALSHTAGQMDRTREHVGAWIARLATWLLLGNAGALVLALQVLRETGSGPQAELAFTSGRLFGIGLVLAFLGATLGYISLLWTRALQSTSVEVAYTFAHLAATEEWNRQRGTPTPDETLGIQAKEMAGHAAKLTALGDRMRKGPNRVGLVSLVIFATSAVIFVSGMTIPLMKLQPVANGSTPQEVVDLGMAAQEGAAPAAKDQSAPGA